MSLTLERLWEHIEPEPMSGCWMWMGTVSRSRWDKGALEYGVIRDGRRYVKVHRAAYELLRGEIPPGLVVDHKCRTTRCCNPAHLDIVTQAENIRRGNGWAGQHMRSTTCPRGHPYDLVDRVKGRPARRCAICRCEQLRSAGRKHDATRRRRQNAPCHPARPLYSEELCRPCWKRKHGRPLGNGRR